MSLTRSVLCVCPFTLSTSFSLPCSPSSGEQWTAKQTLVVINVTVVLVVVLMIKDGGATVAGRSPRKKAKKTKAKKEQ